MKPDRVPREVLATWLQVWADEGFEEYWKVPTRWGRKQRRLT